MKQLDKFIEKALLKHNNRYDYSKVKYNSSKDKVIIICKEHGDFEQIPASHISGRGCPNCVSNVKIDTSIFIKKCIDIHGYKYDYSKIDYIGSRKNVILICKEHGEFLKTPFNILQGQGCKYCSLLNRSYVKEDFIIKANIKHNNKYTYDNSVYINTKTKLIITCKEHGDFVQTPHLHLVGKGCKKCGVKFGKKENKWLDTYNIDNDYRQYKIDRYVVDGYDPKTNTVYEFNGDFWHGNPNKYNKSKVNRVIKLTFGELYEKTLEKEQSLIELGYNVISIWESDFLIYNKNIKTI